MKLRLARHFGFCPEGAKGLSLGFQPQVRDNKRCALKVAPDWRYADELAA